MKRRTFFAVMLGFATIGKWIANIIASEVKNAPKVKPQFTKIDSFGEEKPIRILALGERCGQCNEHVCGRSAH